MNIGNNLYNARKKTGLSQEEVAGKLGVSRQTISNWELNESLPDIFQASKLAKLYHLSLDDLLNYDIDIKELEKIINETNDKLIDKVNWTKVWSKKYPILAKYSSEVDINKYAKAIRYLLEDLKSNYHYSELDAVLVLKDILAHEMKK